jgi:hypothetical protein
MNSDMPDRQSPVTAEADAARVLLSRLGLRAEDLLDTAVPRPTAPTFRDYIPIVAAGVLPGTRRVYGSYWNRIDKHWGERRIDEPTPSQIRQFLVDMQSELVIRRSGRGGHSATEHMIAALRCLYRSESFGATWGRCPANWPADGAGDVLGATQGASAAESLELGGTRPPSATPGPAWPPRRPR